jgi:Flp pilus assembly protein TadG
MEVTMMRDTIHKTRRRGNRRGGAILEMALTLGLLLNLTFGMVEFGYYMYVKNEFANAAREGVRAGMVPGATNTSVTTAVTSALSGCNFPSGSYSTSITDTSGVADDVSTDTRGTAIEVTVSATWGTIGNGFRPLKLIGSSKTISATCVMAKE